MKSNHATIAAVALAGILVPGYALAHTGATGVSGFASGLGHPIGGLDHVLAMVAVGLLAAVLGGRALWLVPTSFVAAMVLGGLIGMTGTTVPFVEAGIALSIVVIAGLAALGWALPVAGAMAIVGIFAVFHGVAHGAEMPVDSSGAAYAAGFALSTAFLHLTGIAAGLLLMRATSNGRVAARGIGAGIAVLGLGVAAGVV